MADLGHPHDPACLTVRVLTTDRRRRIAVSGELDTMAAPLLDEFVRAAFLDLDVARVEVDLSDVTFLGAAGVRSLAMAHRMARRSHRGLVVHCGSRRAVLRPLQVTGLLVVLGIEDRHA